MDYVARRNRSIRSFRSVCSVYDFRLRTAPMNKGTPSGVTYEYRNGRSTVNSTLSAGALAESVLALVKHGFGTGLVHLDARALQNRADIQVLAVRTGVDHFGEVGVVCVVTSASNVCLTVDW